MTGRVLPIVGSTGPWSGGQATGSAHCVLAPNPSPWTLDGTNTWMLTAAGSGVSLVVDPGPRDEGHFAAIRAQAERLDVRISGVLLTHGHIDHAEGARPFAESLGVGVRALDPAHRLGSEGLAGGDVVDMGHWSVEVMSTPGHSADCVSLVVPHDGSILTGDTVLGRGSSLVAWPDGLLADYLESLRRLGDLVARQGIRVLLPGHGPSLADPARVIDEYLAHRLARLAEIAEVVRGGVTDPSGIVEIVYADVPRAVWPAAELTVRAQLQYLADAT